MTLLLLLLWLSIIIRLVDLLIEAFIALTIIEQLVFAVIRLDARITAKIHF